MVTLETHYSSPYNQQTRPCCYCNKNWLQKSPSYRQIIKANDYLQRVGQYNPSSKKTTYTWVCKACLEVLKLQIEDRPVSDYMTTPEEIANATIKLIIEQQEQEEVLAS